MKVDRRAASVLDFRQARADEVDQSDPVDLTVLAGGAPGPPADPSIPSVETAGALAERLSLWLVNVALEEAAPGEGSVSRTDLPPHGRP